MPRKLEPGLSATYSMPRTFNRSTIRSEPNCAAIEPPIKIVSGFEYRDEAKTQRLFEKRVFDQLRIAVAFRCAAADLLTLGIDAVVELLRVRAEADHDERLLAVVGELIETAFRQH